MSLLGNLFNRKGQLKGANAPHKKVAFLDKEEVDFEEVEDLEVGEAKVSKVAVDEQEEQETYAVLEREIHPTKIICPDCGGITLEGLDFCDKCGGELL